MNDVYELMRVETLGANRGARQFPTSMSPSCCVREQTGTTARIDSFVWFVPGGLFWRRRFCFFGSHSDGYFDRQITGGDCRFTEPAAARVAGGAGDRGTVSNSRPHRSDQGI